MQFDAGIVSDQSQEKTADLRKKFRKNIFKGKRLTVFEIKEVTNEAPETETSPSHRVWNLLSI